MTGSLVPRLGFLPKLVIVLALLMLASGFVWHGVTVEVLARAWRQLLDRPSGPVWFRFILQPAAAVAEATIDGIKDARAGASPYLRTMLRHPRKRAGHLREGLTATARLILIGMVMDVVYQLLVLDLFYPAEAVIVALVLAYVPYVLVRGPIARLARWWLHRAVS